MTPLNIRAGRGVTIDAATRGHVQRRLARQLGKLALVVERTTVRFEDLNGKRGGVDTTCSIKIVLSARPSVVIEERAATARAAFDAAAGAAQRAVRNVLGRAEMSAKPRGKRARSLREAQPEPQEQSEGVDTSLPGVSATDRKAGGGSTARRNLKKNLAGLTSALEDSAQSTPSRKSTRRSAGRAKRDNNLQQRETRKLHSPKERARRNLGAKH
jgi:ribosome-associated translation inhibitor RaiA